MHTTTPPPNPPTTLNTKDQSPVENDTHSSTEISFSQVTQSPRSKIPDHTTTTTTTFMQTQDPATALNQLFTLKTKQTKVIQHLAFLETTIQNNVILLGFQIKLTPQVMDAPIIDITQTWDAILIDTSKELMRTTRMLTKILSN